MDNAEGITKENMFTITGPVAHQGQQRLKRRKIQASGWSSALLSDL